MSEQPAGRSRSGEPLALGLGWFSIALGLAEVAIPRQMAQLIGAPEDHRTDAQIRALGAREVGNGVALLAQPHRAAWLWSRVGGDAVDLAWLGSTARNENANTRRLGIATAAVVGVTALDVLCGLQLSREGADGATVAEPRESAPRTVHVERVTTVNRSIDEVYSFWRNFDNFPRFMRHLQAVEIISDRRSRWKARGPAGVPITWEAEILEERPSESITWRSIEGRSRVQNSGTVRFKPAPGGRGTEVRVQMDYMPPAGALGRGLAWLFGEEPSQQVHDDLHRFKQLVETGEIPLSEGPSLWRAAQPAENPDKIRKLAGVQS